MPQAPVRQPPVFFWALDSQFHPTLKFVLYLAIFISQWLCGLATVTSVSRMMFAFSRDGGLPFSKNLARVSRKYRTPVHSISAGSILAVAFVAGAKWLEAGGTPVYTIVVSCTVIFLFFSFAIPIALGLLAHGTAKWPKMGPWDLGPGPGCVQAVRLSVDRGDGPDFCHRRASA
jgi:amino acid transporter